jgi:hypothetical protein
VKVGHTNRTAVPYWVIQIGPLYPNAVKVDHRTPVRPCGRARLGAQSRADILRLLVHKVRVEPVQLKTNRIHLVLFGMQNRTLAPCLAAMSRIPMSGTSAAFIARLPGRRRRPPLAGACTSEACLWPKLSVCLSALPVSLRAAKT